MQNTVWLFTRNEDPTPFAALGYHPSQFLGRDPLPTVWGVFSLFSSFGSDRVPRVHSPRDFDFARISEPARPKSIKSSGSVCEWMRFWCGFRVEFEGFSSSNPLVAYDGKICGSFVGSDSWEAEVSLLFFIRSMRAGLWGQNFAIGLCNFVLI